ncbi:MAG: substrate-binding domain-containing protein [Bacteroidetes bacterium]|nr:substrate-binding domain-containing protein [Bacteroidota bacterium]
MKRSLSFIVSATYSTLIFLLAFLSESNAQKIEPPWSTFPQSGKEFTIPGIDNVPDLHGDVNDPDLVVFFAGNQFMVVPDLIKAFKTEYPQYKRIFVETLPPGILLDQIEQGAIVIGNMRISLLPDIFTAGKVRLEGVQKDKNWFGETVDYARNRLAIMVYKGNPDQITSLRDLGKPGIRVSMPNPQWEGVARTIMATFKKAGGDKLVTEIMDNKVKAGTTFLTHIHHRQTPIRIMEKKSDAGPVWYTEAKFQMMIGNPIDLVEIPAEVNTEVIYTAAALKNAPHSQAAKDFMKFLKSKTSSGIYQKYGFMPVE